MTPVGAAGAGAGVTAFDRADVTPSPTVLMAVTSKVYWEPLVSPLTEQVVAVHEAVVPPGDAVTV